ncbi:ATP-dependent DNA helicase RecG [Candidatus Curtissbacteria bacterium]|nr:ATP-dependent DNA helicase RecG [Candidatus Curtissbacteria bacterium]
MDPQTPVERLPGIGDFYSRKLKKLEILTLEDLIYHFPFRYDDFSNLKPISSLVDGQTVTLQGHIWSISNLRSRTGKFLTLATLADQTGTIDIVWFNQSYLTKTIKPGTFLSVSGKVQQEGRKPKLLAPKFEILGELMQTQTIHTGGLIPVYPETEGVTSKWLRAKIASFLSPYLESLLDPIPKDVTKRQKLLDLSSSLSTVHFPKESEKIVEARKRLAFDELFTLQLASQIRKRKWKEEKEASPFKIDHAKLKEFISSLPFKLTGAQNRAILEILKDLEKETPANRLLEGDVGSGKTVVAAAAAYFAYLNDLVTLFAAPTEILTNQHRQTLSLMLKPYNIKVGIWTASEKQEAGIICGTHALLMSYKPKREVGLVIVDEQHRFGVAQRGKLSLTSSKVKSPHLLTMTATPIPRTLALTLYGDLDLSVLDEMPLGRKKIQTHVVPNFKRKDAYKFIKAQISDGRQAFIITPFVEPSESMVTVKAATEEFKKLKGIFSKKIKLGLMHGKLNPKEKEKVMKNFKSRKIDILVATPVVEVGIDVPNATIMMIESADRFGLAQLHQLRGRVGRGEHKSYCLLFSDSNSQNSIKRLESLESINIGFKLAEIDLTMRGPGEVFGLRQSGYENLKIADLGDQKLIAQTQAEAKSLLELDPYLKKHPPLSIKINNLNLDYVQPN